MVDALRRAHRWLQRDGVLIDLHPTESPASVEVGAQRTGTVDVDDDPFRHAAAGAALSRVVDTGLFAVERTAEFAFYTYADTVEELRDHVEENWRSARIDTAVLKRTSAALRATSGVRPRVREQVRLTRLRPTRVVQPALPYRNLTRR
jgi:hypothetical protein